MKRKFTIPNVLRVGYCILSVFAICIISVGFLTPDSQAENSDTKTAAVDAQSPAVHLEKTFPELINTAIEKGSVRVIIGLKFDFKPVGDLSPTERADQQAKIKQAQNDLLERLQSFNVREVKQFDFIPFMAVETDALALEEMRAKGLIASIQEDVAEAPTLAESAGVVQAPTAWSAGYSGAGWGVAVLDTGVDKNHAFLSPRIISEACYSSNNAAGNVSSVCPGGVTSSTAANSGLNCSTTITGCDHGTHVAGIAAGKSAGFSGVARDANVIAVQVFSRFGNQADCGSNPAPCALSFVSDQIAGLERVLALSGSTSIASVNMSLGGGQFTATCDVEQASRKAAIDNLRSVGIATIVSSGNSGFTNALGAPACISTSVSVGSTGDGSSGATLDVVSSFSNSASFLTILAPGQWINSSVPGGVFSNFSGTSMAAPHVAGAWAILKQRAPSATLTQIQNALASTGLSVTDSRNSIVKPRIRINNALQALSPCTYSLNPPNLSFPAGGGSNSFQVITQSGCTWSTIINAPFSSGRNATDNVFLSALLPDSDFSDTQSEALLANSEAIKDASSAATNPQAINKVDANSVAIAPSATFAGTNTGAIPDGLSGTPPQYGSPRTVNFAVSGITAPISNVSVDMTLSHTWVGDVDAVLAAPGGSPAITIASRIGVTTAGSFGDESNYGGTYNFTDSAAGTNIWSVATNAGCGDACIVTAGNYRSTAPGGAGQTNPAPVTNLTATFAGLSTGQINGTWTLTFRDAASADTGSVSAANLTITGGGTPSGWINITSGSSGNGGGTVNYTVSANPNPTQRSGSITVNGQVHTINQAGTAPVTRRPFDFDGDGKSDISIYRPSNGQWWYLRSVDGQNRADTFGISTDRIAPADYTGDGRTDIAFWRPSNGNWFILRSENGTFYSFPFGTNGDIPAPGDFDGDGRADQAVFRPSNATWYIFRSSGGTTIQQFGANGDVPTAADFDGDGRADIAIWRPSTGVWWLSRSSLGVIAYQFGNSADKPAPGDYTGDGKADVAIWRPSNGNWFVLRSENLSFYSFPFGVSTDIPAPADFDGDGKYDATVFRPSTATWYIFRSTGGNTIQTFGQNGDRPAPSAFIP